MSKDDLTMLLALALAAQRAGIVNKGSMLTVNNVCARAADMHKMMGPGDVLVVEVKKKKLELIGVGEATK